MSYTIDFLNDCKIFYLATIKDNKPAIRPFGAIMEFENNLYFSTANTKSVYEQIVENPFIQIVALKPESREWIRINGLAVEEKNVRIKSIMLEKCPILKKRFDSCNCPYFALFKIIDKKAFLNTDNGISELND